MSQHELASYTSSIQIARRRLVIYGSRSLSLSLSLSLYLHIYIYIYIYIIYVFIFLTEASEILQVFARILYYST